MTTEGFSFLGSWVCGYHLATDPFSMTKRTETKTVNNDKPARKVGRPLAYTPDTLKTKFEEYRRFIADNPLFKEVPTKSGPMEIRVNRPMTIVGFCAFAGILKDTFFDYEKKEDFIHVTTRVRETIESDQLGGAMAGIYDSSIVSRVLRLADRQDVTTNGKEITSPAPPISVVLDPDAAKIIQSIGKTTAKE